MKNWKIGTRIAAGLAAITVIAVMLGVFAYIKVETINARSTQIVTKVMPNIYVVGQIQSAMYNVTGLMLKHTLSTDKDEMARLDNEIRDARAKVTEEVKQYTNRLANDRERSLYDAYVTARNSWSTCYEDVLKLSRTMNKSAAAEMATKQLEPLHRKYVETTDNLVAFNRANADEQAQSINDAVSGTKRAILISVVLALLAAVCISLLVVRSITRPLAAAVDLVSHVSEGDLAHKADVSSRDELGQMLDALNKMVESLKGAANVAVRISEGDLTVQAHALSEKDVLGQALVRMLENLRSTVGEVTSAAASVATGSSEMSSTAQQFSQGATEQAAAAEESTSAMEEMAASVQQNADNARQTDKIASKAAEDAQVERRCGGPHRRRDEGSGREDQHHRGDRAQDRSARLKRSSRSGARR